MAPRAWAALACAAALFACQEQNNSKALAPTFAGSPVPMQRTGAPPAAAPSAPGRGSAAGGSGAARESLAPLVDEVRPTVVGVTTHRRASRQGEEMDELLRRFFGGELGPRQPQTETGIGSGFVIDAQGGLVLTNFHVVQGADEVLVRLASEREVTARVVGTDSATDVALVRLKEIPESLAAAPLGDSDAIRVGDYVVAIGSPFGLALTVTSGIISAKARIIGAGPYDDFLQTDAAINPGNSGGPLFDLEGRVVGINTAIVATGQGIGFAVPINLIKALLPQLERTGKVVRGFLGVTVQDLTPELARAMKLEEPGGALISGVSPGGPASAAGLKPGDVVTSVDGKPVKSAAELSRTVAMQPPGRQIALEVWRGGEQHTIKAKLGERSPAPGAGGQRPARPEEEERLGLSLQPVPPEAQSELGAREGALVTQVAANSRAARAGIARGDVIVEANGQPVRSPQDFARAARAAGQNPLLVRLLRSGDGLFVVIPPSGA